MPTLEVRVSALETRMELAEARNEHAIREARASREAHQKNIDLLNALRMTQAEHTRILAEQSRTLAEHTQTLAGHSQMLAEHGRRLDSIDGKLGTLTVGMHTIEGLLRHLVEAEGGPA